MHIKDHSAAMKFFRTYDNVASKGMWKDFVDEMEFDSMLHEPRTMAQGGRIPFGKGGDFDNWLKEQIDAGNTTFETQGDLIKKGTGKDKAGGNESRILKFEKTLINSSL